MRLTTVANIVPARLKPTMQALATGAPALFLLLILPHAVNYAQDQSFIESPALGSWPSS